jgi:hypothetical protein
MPEVNQIFFTHKELLDLLIKKADIHEGKWMLAANFGFAAANLGQPEQVVPGAAVALLAMGIQRAAPDSPPSMVADAAEVNPAKPST